jgi:type 1 glutamine amidotransferase
MTKTFTAFSLTLTILILLPSLAEPLRIHRVDKLGDHSPTSPRFDHTMARAEGRVVFAELAQSQGWDFTQSSDSELFTENGLADVDIIIFDNNTGILFNESEKSAFEKWVRKGGGIIGIHGVTHAHKGVNENNEAEWPFWYGLWGVLHKSGPQEGPQGRRGYADWITMNDQADERLRQSVPLKWRLEMVEWYFWNHHDNYPHTQVVATADVKANQPELPSYYPVTWAHVYQGGKVWYTNIGHYAENFRQPEFIEHILDGIAWISEDNP